MDFADVLMGIGAVAFAVTALAFAAMFLDWIGARRHPHKSMKK